MKSQNNWSEGASEQQRSPVKRRRQCSEGMGFRVHAAGIGRDPRSKRSFGADVDKKQKTDQRQGAIFPETLVAQWRLDVGMRVGDKPCEQKRKEKKCNECRRCAVQEISRTGRALGDANQEPGTQGPDTPDRVDHVEPRSAAFWINFCGTQIPGRRGQSLA